MSNLIPHNHYGSNLFQLFDDFEKNFFNSSAGSMAPFRCDISEKDNNYLMEAELPGFNEEDIHIEIEGNTLTISAKHETEKEEKDKDGNYIRRERSYGSYKRSFDMNGIDTDKIKADYKNGVLNLTLPKSKDNIPKTRKIEIEK